MVDGQAKWDQTKFLECDTDLELLSVTDKCSAIEVITSDPQISSKDADVMVKSLLNIAQNASNDADISTSVLVSLDNLIRSESEISESDVTTIVNQVVTNVQLSNGNFNVDRKSFATSVVQTTSAFRSIYASTAPQQLYGFTKVLYRGDGLSGVTFQNLNDTTQKTEMSNYVLVPQGGRISFEVYADNSTFVDKNENSYINSVVMSVSQDAESTNNIELKFQLFDRYDLNGAGEFSNASYKVRAICAAWDGTTWSQNDKCSLLSYTDNLNTYVECTCSSAGMYATQMIYGETATPINGLSDAEIAGIVVGCVAFVVILAVLIYCCYNNKKKNKTKIATLEPNSTSVENVQMESLDQHSES
ncbi:uncharacterized protein LOC100181463 [Ciona intestinalis]